MGRPKGSKNKVKKFKKSMVKRVTGRRGRPKGSRNNLRSLSDMGKTKSHILACSVCDGDTPASGEAVSVVCPSCVQKRLPMDAVMRKKLDGPGAKVKGGKRGRPRTRPLVEKKNVGFGRGWHLKKSFTAPDGATYSFGKKVA